MANTYSQITIQCVFAVKGRDNFITHEWRDRLHQYISSIINNSGAFPLAVGGWKDHVHILVGLPTSLSIADLMNKVKSNSSKWINEMKFLKGKFQWQEGYSAFSYSKSHRDLVIKYILNQEEHHHKKSFRDEYFKMLQDFEIQFNEKFAFEFYD